MQCADKQPCVYILASKPNGTLYIGVTSAVFDRMLNHRRGLHAGFTKRYGVHRLVYYELHPTMSHAIRREKQLKKWCRSWKIRIIEEMNPMWQDLFDADHGIRAQGAAGQGLEDR